MDKVTKTIFEPEIKSIDEKKRVIWHKISKETKDRMGDIVRIDGVDTKNFKKKPTVLYGHNYIGLDPLPVIGGNVGFKKEGKYWWAGTKFLDDDGMSQKLKDLVNDTWILAKNKLIGWSVGFIPKKTEEIVEGERVTGFDYKETELLEYSAVLMPANQHAVMDMISKGELSENLAKSMKVGSFDYQNFYDNSLRLHEESHINNAISEEHELPGEVAEKMTEEEITKPSEENHVCRLNNGEYSRYRSEKRKHDGKEYTVRFGIRKSDGKAEEYEYFYPKDTWSASEARSHCKDHKGKFEAAKCLDCDEPQDQGIMPDLINALQKIVEALGNTQKIIAGYLRNLTGGKQNEEEIHSDE